MFHHGPLQSLLSQRKPTTSIQNAHCRDRYVHEMVMLYVHLPTAIVLSWSAGGALQQDDGNTQVTRKSPF